MGYFRAVFAYWQREKESLLLAKPRGVWRLFRFSVGWLGRRPKSTSGFVMCQSIGSIFLDLEWEIAVFAQFKAVFGPEKSVLISLGRVVFRTVMHAPARDEPRRVEEQGHRV